MPAMTSWCMTVFSCDFRLIDQRARILARSRIGLPERSQATVTSKFGGGKTMRFASRKNYGFRLMTVFALCLVFTGVQTARANTSKLTFTNIDVPQATQSVGHAIASDGTVVGLYADQVLATHGFLRCPAGIFMNPIDIQNAAATLILGIDPPAQFVVGVYFDSAGNSHG